MQRVIVKRSDGLNHYDFIGDFEKGEWVSDAFRVRPSIIQRMPNVVWLGETEINGKIIYWPYVEVQPKSFRIVKYNEK